MSVARYGGSTAAVPVDQLIGGHLPVHNPQLWLPVCDTHAGTGVLNIARSIARSIAGESHR